MSDSETIEQKLTELHRFIYENNVHSLDKLLSELTDDRSVLDCLVRGQTSLTLAVTLGRRECIDVLIRHGASCLKRNQVRCTPYQEATSLGDRDIMCQLIKARNADITNWFDRHGKQMLIHLFEMVPDFEIDMNWRFNSWIPFLASLSPSDTYKIYKKGHHLRIDTSLVGFESLSWVRGKISILISYINDQCKFIRYLHCIDIVLICINC